MKSPWPTKKLGDKEYFEILGSGVGRFEGEKEYLSTSSIEGDKIISPEGKITYKERPSRANMQPRLNSVWFARMMNTIKVYSFTEFNKEEVDKYILSTGFAGILCNPEKVDPHYLEKIFLSKWFNVLKDSLASDKAIQKSLNNDDIVNFGIPLPPLPIQQKIVKILNTIQSAVEIQEKIIEKTKELKKSLLNEIFNSKITEGKHAASYAAGKNQKSKLRFKIQRREKLGNLIECSQYGISKKGYDEGQYPILRMNNLDDGKLNLTSLQWVNLENKEFEKYKLKKGDILFNRTNSIDLVGKTALFDIDDSNFVFASYLLRIQTNRKELLPEFLNYYLNWDVAQKDLKKLASRGASQVNISATRLATFLVPIFSLPEQQEVVEILQTVDQKIEIEKRKKELYEELFRTMLNKIMTAPREINLEKIEI
jgi:type I restriction enzyme S subunit